MSAERPPHPESGPEASSAPEPSPEEVALRNTVPPTPEPPLEDIAATRERLSHGPAPAGQASAPTPPTRTVATPSQMRGSFGRIASGAGNTIVRGVKAGGGFLYGFFGYIFVEMIWRGLKNLPAFGGGGGGGGGHSKPSGGGGHH